MPWKLEGSFAALRHRNFRMFVSGQFVSLIGFWMQNVGQSWLVYRLTHSSAYLGAIAFASQIPILLFSFAAGAVVDRVNRRRLVILTQTLALVQAGILWILTYLKIITIPQLFVLAAFAGMVASVDLPARQAFLIQMVGKEDLMNAIAINSSMFNAARMVGPALAGYVLARWGEAACFLLNAITYLAVLLSLVLMKIMVSANGVVRKSLIRDLAEGFHYVRGTRPVRVMLLLVGALGTAGFPFVVLLPVFADGIFHRGATGLAWLVTGVGLGALCGALFLAGRKGLRGMSRMISICATGFSLALGLFGISPNFWLSFVLAIFGGVFMMITIASINTVIQSLIPDALRGRVMSLFTTMLIGTAPVGSLIAGAIAKYRGVQFTTVLMSVLCLAASVWFYRTVPFIVVETRRILQMQNPEFQPPVQ